MNVCVAVPSGLSRAMTRVEHALIAHAPLDVRIVKCHEEADLSVLHAIGVDGMEEQARAIRARGGRYAMIQYCLRSTRWQTGEWRRLWSQADVVWSYYDLAAATREDGGEVDFVHFDAPLGVDEAFKPSSTSSVRNYTVLTSGYVAETECAHEAAEAVRRVGGNQFHLGPDLRLGQWCRSELGITDAQLASVYRAARYVSGLRRVEGFELPAAEGLVCGARPICFDRSHYRRWFEPWARFIPEGSHAEVTDALERLFRQDAFVTGAEATAAAERFNWSTIIPAFWQCVGVHQKQETA